MKSGSPESGDETPANFLLRKFLQPKNCCRTHCPYNHCRHDRCRHKNEEVWLRPPKINYGPPMGNYVQIISARLQDSRCSPATTYIFCKVYVFNGSGWTIDDSIMKSPFSSERLFFGSKQVEVNDLLIGQSTFADFDLDGRNDHVLPVCTKDDCSATARFYFWHQAGNCWSNWTLNLTDPNPGGQTWSFVDPASPLSTVKGSAQVGVETMTFRPGDFSRDGYVDLIGVLQNGSRPENRFAFLLENRPCMHASEAGVTRQLSLGKRTEEPCDETEPRLFEVLWTPLAGQSRATTTGFLDLSEDGTLDTFVEALDGASKPLVIFVESDEKGDTCFLRAQVFTGRCAQQTCPLGREGSGVTLPGACLYYESVDPDGHKRKGTDCQLTQSTHRALQLPYALFGLGQSPNFVDFLTVAVPDRRPQNRSFPQIVPNSRLYVIPHPTNDPSEWIYRLYVTPSRLILLSFATLSCVCGVILFIIVVLQIQEKRADKRERLQEAHKFHFDAM